MSLVDPVATCSGVLSPKPSETVLLSMKHECSNANNQVSGGAPVLSRIVLVMCLIDWIPPLTVVLVLMDRVLSSTS